MPAVDRDLEEIIEFCKKFDSEVLQVIEENASSLSTLSGNIESALYNTQFATKASGTVKETATKLKSAVAQGEQRIREIQKKAEADLERSKTFER